MANTKIGNLYLHFSKRGIAYKWGMYGEIHRFSFERFTRKSDPYDADDEPEYRRSSGRGSQYDPDDDYDEYDEEDEGEERGLASFLYGSDWLFWVLLVVFPPLGIWILWQRKQFDPMIRAAIAAASAIWLILLVFWLIPSMIPKADNRDRVALKPTMTASPQVQITPTPTPITASVTPTNTAGEQNGSDIDDTDANTADDTDDTEPVVTEEDETTKVFISSNGTYYHKQELCNNIAYSLSVTLKYATDQNKKPCPSCYGSGTVTGDGTGTDAADVKYYATANGKYYHNSSTCSSMKGAAEITEQQALAQGKQKCPECLGVYYMTPGGTYYHLVSNCDGMKGAVAVSKAEAVAANKKKCPLCLSGKPVNTGSPTTFYSTSSGKYYHADKVCSGMKNASSVSKAVAEQRKQTACPICVGAGENGTGKYYATSSGKYYHVKSECSGMKNATAITLATARSQGKSACPECIGSSSSSSSSSSSTKPSTYYATKAGAYFHTDKDCSGMKNAIPITLAQAAANNKTQCPKCVKSSSSSSSSSTSGTYAYMTSDGRYYHSKNDCSGMKGARKVKLATAKTSGKTACPVCIGGKASVTPAPTKRATASTAPNTVRVTDTEKKTYCYATENGSYYHKTSNCSGMSGAKKITIATAKQYGKKICPVCAGSSSSLPKDDSTEKAIYYGVRTNKYYHTKANCGGMTGASKLTLTSAKSKKLSPCPTCVLNETTSKKVVTTYCYVSKSNNYYHTKKGCSDMASPTKVTLETAKSRGRTACPTCAGRSLDTKVYVSSSGDKKYHSKGTCNGVVLDTKVSISAAINNGYSRCTRCSAPKASTRPPYTPKPGEVTPEPIDRQA